MQEYHPMRDKTLAINGGEPIRSEPMPYRQAFGPMEEEALLDAVRYYRDNNIDPPYQGIFEKRFCDEFVEGYHHKMFFSDTGIFLRT